MNKCLIAVDVQNDFITGALANSEAAATLPRVRQVVDYAKEHNWDFIFTMDTHHGDYLNTQEGHNLPVYHCMENTWGWNIVDNLVPKCTRNRNVFITRKKTFGSTVWNHPEWFNNFIGINELVFVGYCSDICVISNVLGVKAAYPEIPITFISDASAGVTPEKHAATCEVMRSCQVNVVTWDEYLKNNEE